MSECTHECSTCGKACSSREGAQDFTEPPNENSHVKKIVGIVSGKGGVGKSMTCSMLAVLLRRLEYSVGVLDADITGPSIPHLFGINRERSMYIDNLLMPVKTKTGIDVMSVNLVLENETDPVVWRGPVVAGTVKQFWQDVLWKDIDFLFIDMPPGTGDVPLTVFQTLPVDGIIVVASPQELVSMIVEKAVNMAKLMNIPILGLVENMSYVQCPCCDEKIELYGKSKAAATAEQYKIPLLGRMPVYPPLAALADCGAIEGFEGDWLDAAAKAVQALV